MELARHKLSLEDAVKAKKADFVAGLQAGLDEGNGYRKTPLVVEDFDEEHQEMLRGLEVSAALGEHALFPRASFSLSLQHTCVCSVSRTWLSFSSLSCSRSLSISSLGCTQGMLLLPFMYFRCYSAAVTCWSKNAFATKGGCRLGAAGAGACRSAAPVLA